MPLRRMRGEIHAVELLDDVLELVCDELCRVVLEQRDLDGRWDMATRPSGSTASSRGRQSPETAS